MIELLKIYVIGLLVTANIVIIWFETNLSAHLTNLAFRIKDDKLFTRRDFEDFTLTGFPKFFAELLTCKICFSHWVAFFVAGSISAISGFWWIWLVGVLTYPAIIYIIDKK